jgi:type III pantothenate kinase
MLLTFDIGNTNIVVGCFQGDKLLFELRLRTESGRTIDEYQAVLATLLQQKLGATYGFKACIISSVVPPVTGDIVRLVREMLKLEPLMVGPGIKTGLQIKISEPSAVGSDRIVNSVAARELFGCPAVVVDFGTATSFDVISAEGNYEGGIIAPGINIALEALVKRTAKLPRIDLTWPKSVVGKSTVGAMQSGVLVGYVCMVDGLVDAVEKEIGEFKHVLATGGLGRVVSEHSQRIKTYDPHLTLKGLRVLAGLNGIY